MTNGVQFDIDTEPRAVVQTKTPAMVRLVIKFSGGLIKDTTQANYVLFGLVILTLATTFMLWPDESVPTEREQKQVEGYIQNMNNLPR